MIDLNFGLWWSGSKLSYLRYLTFKSLRHFHPHSRIQLYTNNKFIKNDCGTNQEFTRKDVITEDYLFRLKALDVEVVRVPYFPNYSPNHQSDLFRYWFLKHHGGVYLDADQIILKSFKSLPLKKYDFIYSCYEVESPFVLSGKFAPVGVLGSVKNSKVVNYIYNHLDTYYDESNYNSIGPLMFLDLIEKGKINGFNAPHSYFYPAPVCDYMNKVFNGKMKIMKDNMCLHWFGGHNESQKFNKSYTEEFARESNDTISRFLREKRII